MYEATKSIEIQRCRIVHRHGHLHLPWGYRREWYSVRLVTPLPSGSTVDRTKRRRVFSWFPGMGRRSMQAEFAGLLRRLEEKGWRIEQGGAEGLPLLWRLKPNESTEVADDAREAETA